MGLGWLMGNKIKISLILMAVGFFAVGVFLFAKSISPYSESGKEFSFTLPKYIKGPLTYLAQGQILREPSGKVRLQVSHPNPVLESFKFVVNDGELLIAYEDYNTTTEPQLKLTNGTIWGWDEMPSNIQKTLWAKKPLPNTLKYGADFFNVTTAQKNSIENFIFHQVDSKGLTKEEVKVRGKDLVIRDKLTISSRDLLQTYSLPVVNETDIVVGNLSRVWVVCLNDGCTRNETRSNWKDNGDGTWNISFDPVVTIDESSYLSNAEFSNVSASSNITKLDFPATGIINKFETFVHYSFDIELNPYNNYATNGNVSEAFKQGDSTDPSFNTSGYIGGAYTFEFDDDTRINLGNFEMAYEQLTLSAWLKFESDGGGGDLRIIAKSDADGDLWMMGETDNNPRFRVDFNTVVDTSTTFVNGEWIHFLSSYNSTAGEFKIYINGINTATGSNSGVLPTDGSINVMLGSRTELSNFYDGEMDDVWITNRSTGAADAWDLFNLNFSRFEPTGTMDLWDQSAFELNISTGNNRVNVTTTFLELNGSSLNLSVGYYDGSWTFTDPQTITTDTNQTFVISDTSTNISLNYTLIAGGNDGSTYYSPAVHSAISYEPFNVGGADNAPTFSDNETNNTIAGEFVLHSLKWEDETALAGYIFSFDNGTGTFINDSFVGMTGTTNHSNVTKFVNETVGSTIRWIVYANDSASQLNVSDTYIYTTTAPPDTQPPVFTTIPPPASIDYLVELGVLFVATDNVALDIWSVNDSLFIINSTGFLSNNSILSGGFYLLNVSINDTSGNVNSTLYNVTVNAISPGISFVLTPSNSETYGVETTATGSGCPSQLTCTLHRDSITVSNPEVATLGVTTYNYTFNTTGNVNYTSQSVSDILTVTQATPTGTLVNNTLRDLTYNAPFNTTFTESNTVDGDVTYLIFRDSVDVTSEDNVDVELAVGTYNYTLNTTGGTNFTAVNALDTFLVTISQNSGACDVLFNETSPVAFPGVFTVFSNCNSAFVLTRNGTTVSNNSVQQLGAGAYNFTVQRTDTANFSNIHDEEIFAVSQGDPSLALALTPSNSEDYLVATTATGSNCPSPLTCTLHRDSITVSNPEVATLGVTTYNYTFNTTGNVNYTSDSISEILTVNAINPDAVLVNNTLRDLTYPAGINVTFSESNSVDGDVTYNLFRDSINIDAEDNVLINLSVGTFNYTLNTTGGTNYTSNVSLDTFLVTISQNSGACDVLFNETSPVTFPEVFTVFSNCNSAFVLTRNGTVISNNSVQALAVGAYNFSVQRTDTVNYSNIYDEEVFVVSGAETQAPNVTIFSPTNITFTTTTILFNVSAVDTAGISLCWYSLNGGTTNNTMSNPGGDFWNATNSSMDQGGHTSLFFCNDTLGNLNNTEQVTFTVDTIPPTFDNLRNFSHIVNTSFSESITATDATSSIDVFSLNDTSVFTINSSTGLITNVTPLLVVQTYPLNISVNDTVGNVASGYFEIEVVEELGLIMKWVEASSGDLTGYVRRSGEWFMAGLVQIGTALSPAQIKMFSPNGTEFDCGPNNLGVWECA